MTRKTYILMLVISILVLNPIFLGFLTLIAPCLIIRNYCEGKFIILPPNPEFYFLIGFSLGIMLISYLSIQIYKTKTDEKFGFNWIKIYLAMKATMYIVNFLFRIIGTFIGSFFFFDTVFVFFNGVLDIVFLVYVYFLLKSVGFLLSSVLRFVGIVLILILNSVNIYQFDIPVYATSILRYILLTLHFSMSVILSYSLYFANVENKTLIRFKNLAVVIILSSFIGLAFSIFLQTEFKNLSKNFIWIPMYFRTLLDVFVLGFYFYAFWNYEANKNR